MRAFSEDSHSLGKLQDRGPSRPRGAAMSHGFGLPRRGQLTPLPALLPRIEIRWRQPSPEFEFIAAHVQHARQLARQDAWDMLASALRRADSARDLSPGGKPVTSLLARGARADMISTLVPAVQSGDRATEKAVLDQFNELREEDPENADLAFVVASAHVAVAELWRNGAAPPSLSETEHDRWRENLLQAAALANAHDAFDADNALWAMIRCSVLPATPAPASRLSEDFQDLIDLDPRCNSHMEAFGQALTPGAFGTLEDLEVQARQAARNTRDLWGEGAYAWIWIGALETDPDLSQHVDATRFITGLRDILRASPDQYTVNRLAAFTAVTVPLADTMAAPQLAVSDCFEWIARDHLTELHPEVWAEALTASRPFAQSASAAASQDTRTEHSPGSKDLGESASVEQGRALALSALSNAFADQLSRDGRLIFSSQGLQSKA